jgi:hypothetical protein
MEELIEVTVKVLTSNVNTSKIGRRPQHAFFSVVEPQQENIQGEKIFEAMIHPYQLP